MRILKVKFGSGLVYFNSFFLKQIKRKCISNTHIKIAPEKMESLENYAWSWHQWFYCHENFLRHKRFCFAKLAEKDTAEIFVENFFNINNFFNQLLDSNDSNFLKHFSECLSLVAPVRAIAGLYWVDCSFLWNDSLKGRL